MSQEVDFLRTIYTNVAQSNERARMEEARDTPVIMVLDPPSLPPRPDSRRIAVFGTMGLLMGATLGIGVALLLDLRDRLGASGNEFGAPKSELQAKLT
jgi:uncharacterized protein involved in exopolysaccharide biosynthesis